MHFWNIKALAHQLKDNKLTEADKFKYLLVFSLFYVFAVEISIYLNPHKYQDIETILLFVIHFGGLCYLYKINQSIDHQNFIERYVCLGLPVTIRYIVFFTIVYILILIMLSLVGIEDENPLIDVVIITILEFGFFIYFGRNLTYLKSEEM